MPGFSLAILAIAFAGGPVDLPDDVHEIKARDFYLPIYYDQNRLESIETLRLFVSEDSGKTWKHQEDYSPSENEAFFAAKHDGPYWFAIQIKFKSGRSVPAKLDDLTPTMKVYVNTEHKAPKSQPSIEELQREVRDLQKRLKQIQKRLKKLGADRNQNKAAPDTRNQ